MLLSLVSSIFLAWGRFFKCSWLDIVVLDAFSKESLPLRLEYTPFSETQLRPGPLTLLADRL